MNLNVIVEGPDNVGKTTIIKNIKNHYVDITFHTLHYSDIKQKNIESTIDYNKKMYTEMFKIMIHQSKFKNTGIICDRSHLGEMVYGPIYRNYSGDYVLEIEKKFNNYDIFWNTILLITCYDDPKNLIARDDGLSFSTNLKKKTIEIDNFLNAHKKSNIKNKLLLNIKNNNANSIKSIVINKIGTIKENNID
jgi:thymidylate kinase